MEWCQELANPAPTRLKEDYTLLDMKLALGFRDDTEEQADAQYRTELRHYINLKLAVNGLPTAQAAGGNELVALASELLTSFREKTRLLDNHRCPVDARIEAFLNEHFADLELHEPMRVPGRAVVLDRHGLARELSLPANGDEFQSELLHSYRCRNGVLHNPRSDRRTTAGTFHVAEGGLPIPGDKRAVPRKTYVELFMAAVNPPRELLLVPFTANQAEAGYGWMSVLLRPVVCPEVPGYCLQKTMETRFFAPASLVSNLDFVESIFGNAGDPFVPMNDAGLDVEHWSGHTGCVILAPHLTGLTKRDVGLPHVSQATPRQVRDRMCWEHENERYNDGEAFKVTCRTDAGVMVTIIADNYFGYCKKEVKTQISYAANLMGGVEEEHAGGALVFPSWSMGEDLQVNSRRYNGRTFEDVVREYGQWIDVKREGYGIDKKYPDLIYIPEDARADLRQQNISWVRGDRTMSIPLLPAKVYLAPSGYKVRMEKHPSAPSWRIIGTAAEGTFCHKPCTVSGGGKSEISKSLVDYMQYGSVFVADVQHDLDLVQEILDRKYEDRWTAEMQASQNYKIFPSRPILNPLRTLGSVIKLLTPSEDYNDDYNTWLKSIPAHIYAIVYAVKRFYNPAWGSDWRRHFSVDLVNGSPGHELKWNDRKIVGTYLRVGLAADRSWRTFKVRQDFAAASKVQNEDDISASVVVPSRFLQDLAMTQPRAGRPASPVPAPAAVKFITNCESRLFQRPDDAIHRGFDKQAEADLSRRGANFVSNFEPLTRADVEDMLSKVVDFDVFTPPMKRLLESVLEVDRGFVVCSDIPRRVDGVPSKNPRYLQDRPDIVKPIDRYVAEMGTRFWRKIPAHKPVHLPVNAVISGRRNNPPDRDRGIRSLAVYGPIHYQELPELFMDYICSLTGKSPSTTGAGSEGALTKGPFNALLPTADINTALVSMILTELPGYSTAAGHIGPKDQFDHDISLLIPELWSRMSPDERDPRYLISERLLEPIPDFKHRGEAIPASRLGYRITERFVRRFFGRIFDNPERVFDKSILQPETQDLDSFADGVKYIVEAQQRSAQQYIDDGSIEFACPPLKALLTIMAQGCFQGKTERDPEIRQLFSKESLLASPWYRERLITRQQRDLALWERHRDYLSSYLQSRPNAESSVKEAIYHRQRIVAAELDLIGRPEYVEDLVGTLGAEPRL
jgi:phosphoenolpyruvate carboxykinase (diphosphate)